MFRNIVHLGIPDFYAAMEELRRPELKKRPLVLAEPGERSVIQGLNGIARREGITEGMPLGRARRLCRRIVMLPSDLYYYRERHSRIVEELGSYSPLIEGASPGRYFVDITGARRLMGPEPDIACRIEKDLVQRLGLHARIGLAANKLVSQVAAACLDPGDLGCIFPGGEESFLAPLPVDYLPGVGAVTVSRLADFNIQRVGQLAEFSSDLLADVFGKTARRLLAIAKGIDTAPVFPFQKAPRLALTRAMDRDEIDMERLRAVLFQLVEEAGWSLRGRNRCPGVVRVEIRYADGVSVQAGTRIAREAVQADRRLFGAVLPLFLKLFCRRIALRRMVLEFSDFSMPLRQLSLFPWDGKPARAENSLQRALDGIRSRFGTGAISWGRLAALQGIEKASSPPRVLGGRGLGSMLVN